HLAVRLALPRRMLATPTASTHSSSALISNCSVAAATNSFPVWCRMEKGSPAQAANMDFHFIDFILRRSEYGSNRCRRRMETKMSFRLPLILSTALAPWPATATAETIKIGVTPGPHAQILEAVKPIAAKQ